MLCVCAVCVFILCRSLFDIDFTHSSVLVFAHRPKSSPRGFYVQHAKQNSRIISSIVCYHAWDEQSVISFTFREGEVYIRRLLSWNTE